LINLVLLHSEYLYSFSVEPFVRPPVQVVIGFICACVSLCAIQSYFWTYNAKEQQCVVRPAVTEGGEQSLWNIWSWVSEMLIFFLVPLVIFVFNVLVIREVFN